jgi:hypothetical protein
MRALILAAVVLLAGCGLSEKQRDEVDDIADAAVSDNEKVSDLESRISAIEQRLEMTAEVGEAKVRKSAMAQWRAANDLDRALLDMRDKYAKGPGATHGLMGFMDWLPLSQNSAFDDAGRSSLVIIAGARDFKLSSAEVKLLLDTYMPKSSNYDSVNIVIFKNLESLRDSSRQVAIMTLGGVPDAMGNITPLPLRKPPPSAPSAD